jgi:hypothetical protein
VFADAALEQALQIQRCAAVQTNLWFSSGPAASHCIGPAFMMPGGSIHALCASKVTRIEYLTPWRVQRNTILLLLYRLNAFIGRCCFWEMVLLI